MKLAVFLATSIIPLLGSCDLGLTVQQFAVTSLAKANNAKLSWSQAAGASMYQVFRNSILIANTTGTTFDDYDVLSSTVTYQVKASNDSQSSIDASTVQSFALQAMSKEAYSMYNNTIANSLRFQNTYEVYGTYYCFSTSSAGVVQSTSKDGYNCTNPVTVLPTSTICASTNGSCNLESVSFTPHPGTQETIMWAHFEAADGYNLGEVAVAWGMAGDIKSWKFGGAFRPLGHDSRDLSLFADADGSAYLISATNTNQDMNIYVLTSDWHNVSALVTTVLKGQRREAPALMRVHGFYYLFTSLAAGWYPSAGTYISATSLKGPWSEQKVPGNTATFGAQSGGIISRNYAYAMQAIRWAANWKIPESSNRQIVLPISLVNGSASYHYYEQLAYLPALDNSAFNFIGVQVGKAVSIGKPSFLSEPSNNTAVANDGTQNDGDAYLAPQSVPFWYEIDLMRAEVVSGVQLTTRLIGGSETYYSFNVTGSNDRKSWVTLTDESRNTAVGFVASPAGNGRGYRYVRLNVQKVVNIQNGNEADSFVGIEEFTVYSSSS